MKWIPFPAGSIIVNLRTERWRRITKIRGEYYYWENHTAHGRFKRKSLLNWKNKI